MNEDVKPEEQSTEIPAEVAEVADAVQPAAEPVPSDAALEETLLSEPAPAHPTLERIGNQGWIEVIDAATGDLVSRRPPPGQE